MAAEANQGAPNRVVDTILARRSIRIGFEDRPVAREHLDVVLQCGLAAPSSRNARPWRFHVVTDTDLRYRIADAAASASGVDEWLIADEGVGGS